MNKNFFTIQSWHCNHCRSIQHPSYPLPHHQRLPKYTKPPNNNKNQKQSLDNNASDRKILSRVGQGENCWSRGSVQRFDCCCISYLRRTLPLVCHVQFLVGENSQTGHANQRTGTTSPFGILQFRGQRHLQ